jgi:hypothetical protein
LKDVLGALLVFVGLVALAEFGRDRRRRVVEQPEKFMGTIDASGEGVAAVSLASPEISRIASNCSDRVHG